MTPPVAVALTDLDEWYAVHTTAYCHRMAARITAAACEHNRKKSPLHVAGDLRCAGCGGLDNQAEPRPHGGTVLTLIQGGLDQDGRGDREEAAPGESWHQEAFDLDGPDLDDADELAEDEAEESIKALAAGLLAFMRDHTEDEELEEEEPEREWVELPDLPERRGRVAVFIGRCVRCDGGMLHAGREGNDDEIYRCLNCGWRTSPEYEENRRAGARGW